MADPLAIFRDPPRRMAMDDPDFRPELGQAVEIWLDGYEQHKVLAYDCDAGTIERLQVDGFGDCIVRGDEVVTETVTGDVRVRWRHRPR